MNKRFNRIFLILCALLFVLVCIRAFLIPLSHDEAATFFLYVQNNNYLPYSAFVYTNNHVLNSALENLCYHLAGTHPFVLRIPNILSFLVFCLGVFRHFSYFKSVHAKLVLVAFFLLTFRFLDFFELSRGYGISLGCMLLGLSCLMDYFQTNRFKYLVFFSICWQLALCANLILAVVLAVLLCTVWLFQFRSRLLFKGRNLVLQAVNLLLLGFWIKFGLFYKTAGVLDYGVGDNYWVVSFRSLIFILFGHTALWLQATVIGLGLFVLGAFIRNLVKNSFSINALFRPDLYYPFLLLITLFAFFLQKILLHVNYPEDRTGLFFFLFFILSLAFAAEAIPETIRRFFAYLCLGISTISFALTVNFTDFTSWFYQTMPQHIYDVLCQEQRKSGDLITIGGHRMRELNYAFLNYRNHSPLNVMDNSDEMQMNCDYYYAMRREEPYYRPYYEEIDLDKTWDRVLLRRKEKIMHQPVYTNTSPIPVDGNGEYFNFVKLPDTTFQSHNPLEIEAGIRFETVPGPFNAFLVLSMLDAKGETTCYKCVHLNWIAENLSGQTRHWKLTSSNLPDKVRSFTVYLWNIDKKQVRLTLTNLKIYQLMGKGVDVQIPASYYPSVEKLSGKPLL